MITVKSLEKALKALKKLGVTEVHTNTYYNVKTGYESLSLTIDPERKVVISNEDEPCLVTQTETEEPL